jgi:hypothetical protein
VAFTAILVCAATPAQARTEVVPPVREGKRALVFDFGPIGSPGVTGATAHIRAVRHHLQRKLRRYQGRPAARHRARRNLHQRLHRRLQVRRVRAAAASGTRLRVAKPVYGGGGRVKIRTTGTIITSGPIGSISSGSAAFEFTSSESGSTFQCRLDSSEWSACASAKHYSGLADGEHSFEVLGTSATGNVDAVPASRTFIVDTAAPDTAIDSGPAGTISEDSARFGFSSSESGSRFECRLDGASWAPCTNPKSYDSLAGGLHDFSVRAMDPAGNVDTSPASRSFDVDVPAVPEFSASKQPSADWTLYGEQSVFNTPIDERAGGRSVDPNSAVKIAPVRNGNRPTLSTTTNDSWALPIYYGRDSDPRWRIELSWGTGNVDYINDIDGTYIHMPENATASLSTSGDQNLHVYDQTNGFYYMLRLGPEGSIDRANNIIYASKGNRLDAEGSGFRYADDPPTNPMAIRPEELAAGQVNHIMALNVRCLSGTPVGWYAESRSIGRSCDSSQSTTNTLSFGDVVYLDMTEQQISNSGAPTYVKAIMRGLATYGAVVARNSGSDWYLSFENRLDRTSLGQADPYQRLGVPLPLRYGQDLADAGALDRLRVAVPRARG